MNAFLALPLEVRLVVFGLIGVLVGTQVNRGIYRLAWFPRFIGPWSPPHPDAPPRRPADRIPIIGWWNLRRESKVHGRGYWIRPLLLEVGTGVLFALIYWHETVRFGVGNVDPGQVTLHLQCVLHLVLVTLMLIATFIDFDEQTIPDSITLPGTLLGLLFAATGPLSRAIVMVPAPTGFAPQFLHLASATARPGIPSWPPEMNGGAGLILGIACFVAWVIAIMPGTWTMRRGLVKAFQLGIASLQRRGATKLLGGLVVFGCSGIGVVWFLGGVRWESLLSALVGMAVGGAAIWGVRIVGTYALGQEAMGFGDVTLMAMIGAYTGWQATLVIFFLAPFSAIFIAVSQYLLTRRHDIAFGPYLCLSALIWIEYSGFLWMRWGLPVFSMGWIVPAIGITGLFLMGAMLIGWRAIRNAVFGTEP